MDVDEDKDDFAPIRSSNTASTPTPASAIANDIMERIIPVSVNILLMSQRLQSPEGETFRDKVTIDILNECSWRRMHVLLNPLMQHVEERTIHFGTPSLEMILEKLGKTLTKYESSRSEVMQALVIRVLSASLHLWAGGSTDESEAASKVADLLLWLTTSLRQEKIGNWVIRDLLAQLLDRYIHLDPRMIFWRGIETEEGSDFVSPDVALAGCNMDRDMRVRFRSALACARLFIGEYIRDHDPMETYQLVRDNLCIDLDK
jgi:ataxia telangiectasia mutated family protein